MSPFQMPFRRLRTRGNPSRSRGVSLIEVLVSVVVLSIGMLGAAALQASALRGNQGSFERTQISILTQSIFDAMRANRAAVMSNAYNTSGWLCSAPSTGTLAGTDLARWYAALQAQVQPGACGRIECNAGACSVSTRWDDSRSAGGGSSQIVTLRAQL
jgi:type IV pilus assembly protein PilV